MIRQATQEDAFVIAQLAARMWDNHTTEELAEDFARLIADENTAVFLCCDADDAIGFAQCQLRNDYVEGTETSPVGYLEGVFVKEEYRKQGCAKALLSACEQWAKQKGCTEFASDCELNNAQSIEFHTHCGFIEANRIICFTKKI